MCIRDRETYFKIINNNKTEGPNYENGVAILKLLLNAGAKFTNDFIEYQQKQVDKEKPPVELRRELLDIIKQYANK